MGQLEGKVRRIAAFGFADSSLLAPRSRWLAWHRPNACSPPLHSTTVRRWKCWPTGRAVRYS